VGFGFIVSYLIDNKLKEKFLCIGALFLFLVKSLSVFDLNPSSVWKMDIHYINLVVLHGVK